jgi:hypothetical protein
LTRRRVLLSATPLLSLTLILACCGEGELRTPSPDVSTLGGVATFELSILSWDRCGDLRDARDFEEAERITPTLESRAPLVTLTPDDIDAYDPVNGVLTLSAPAIKRVIGDTGLPPAMAHAVLSEGCFVVMIGGRRLFGGLTLSIETARGVDIPTIFPVASGDSVRLLIRPAVGGVFIREALDRYDPSILSRIHPDELRSYFASVGKLTSP